MFRKSLLIAVLTLLCSSFCIAAKICGDIEDDIPSVDEDGSANFVDDLGVALFHLCVNTKNGKFQAKGTGQTTNNSGETQTYKNDPLLADFYFSGDDSITVSRSKLRVKADGAAKILLKGTDASGP